MKKNTRDYPKNFAGGGSVPKFTVDLENETMKQTGGPPIENNVSPEDQAGGGATWATKAQKSKAARRIAQGFVP